MDISKIENGDVIKFHDRDYIIESQKRTSHRDDPSRIILQYVIKRKNKQ